MRGIAEIQEAIVQLTPEEQVQLREWLNGLDAEWERRWAAVALERLEAIRAGEPTLEADEVFAEARRLAAGWGGASIRALGPSFPMRYSRM